MRRLWHCARTSLPCATFAPDAELPFLTIRASNCSERSRPCFAHAALIVDVDVDDETGEIDVIQMNSAYELGRALNPRLVVAFIYPVIVPGLVATWVWFKLVGRIGAVRAATFHFLTPFFGVATGALLLGKQLAAGDVIGVGVIMAGILAVQLSKAPAAAVPVRRPPPA